MLSRCDIIQTSSTCDVICEFNSRLQAHGPAMLLKVVQLGTRLAICTLSAGALLFASGCTRSHSLTVAVIPETTAQELWEVEHAGVASAAIGTNWEIYWNGPSREDDVDCRNQIRSKASSDETTTQNRHIVEAISTRSNENFTRLAGHSRSSEIHTGLNARSGEA
jgi:hypothetical protein